MDIKDIKKLKKEIKIDNFKFVVKDLVSSYLKKDDNGAKILFSKNADFNSLDIETQSMYLDMFKKIISTDFDKKIFNLKFNSNETKNTLALINKNKGGEEELIAHLCENYNHDFDGIVNVMKVDWQKENDDTFKEITLIAINKVEQVKKTLSVKAEKKEVVVDKSLDYIMKLNPTEGLVYPSLTGENEVLYYIGKPKELSKKNVSEWLGVDFNLTATEEKDEFVSILSTFCKDISMNSLFDIYKELKSRIDAENRDESVVNTKEIKSILERQGVNVDKYDDFVSTLEGNKYKIINLIPQKKLTIASDGINIAIAEDKIEKILNEESNILSISTEL